MMKHTFDAAGPGDDVELVQRFVDQELSAEERVQFLSRLGRDEALRRRTIELEQLVLDAGRLPRPIVPDGFAASVMERLGPPVVATARTPARPSVWRRFIDALFAPRALHWNLANAMTVAVVAVAVIGLTFARTGINSDGARGLIRVKGARQTANVTPIAAVSPSTTLVRLVITQPGAKTVQVAGDFNGWNPARTSLEQISDGAWAVTIPLKPGRYAYMFVVDGKQWVADPFAAEQKDDGFGSRNAVLEVRPPEIRPGASL
jgi:anti-sigma factor RsiW